jgi:hypothetical protein
MAASAQDAIAQAARNNAAWCDAVAASHHAAGRFLPDLWCCEQQLPPFFPNLVTLTADGQAVQREHIAALLERGPPLPWALKDSFARLELTAMGFDLLFEASWIFDPPGSACADRPDSSIDWHRIGSAAELAAWETAWRRDLPAGPTAIFRPALLENREIAFLAGIRAETIVAGCVLNIAAGAVGLSNLFSPADMRAVIWSACRDQARAFAPQLPIVGYESGEDLIAAQTAGFRVLGPLRVWLRSAGAG